MFIAEKKNVVDFLRPPDGLSLLGHVLHVALLWLAQPEPPAADPRQVLLLEQ